MLLSIHIKPTDIVENEKEIEKESK